MSSLGGGPAADPGAGRAAADATTGSSVLAGGAWHATSLILPQLYIVVISVVAARVLGPDGMGKQSFIAFVQLSVVLVFSAGMAASLMRFIGEIVGRGRGDLVRSLVAWGWRIQLAASVAGGAVLVLAALLRAELQEAWLLAAVGAAFAVLHAVPTSVLLGMQRWREASIVGLATGSVGTVATVVVLLAGGGITGMFAVEAVVSAVGLAWTSWYARRYLAGLSHEGGSVAEIRGPVVRFAAFSLARAVLSLVVWRRSEFFFLDWYSTDTQIALYSVTFAAVTALGRIPAALAAVSTPAFATLYGAGDMERIRAGFERGARLMLYVAMPMTAAVLALGPEALRLVYGEDYSGTGPVLVVMMVVFPLLPLFWLSAALTSGLGKIRTPLLLATGAAVVNIALDFWLVASYDAVGAAMANSAAQLVATIPLIAYSASLVGGVEWRWWSLLRVAAVSAVAGLAAALPMVGYGGVVGLVLGGLVGSAVFAVAAVAVRPFPSSDLRWLDEAVGERVGGSIGTVLRTVDRLASH